MFSAATHGSDARVSQMQKKNTVHVLFVNWLVLREDSRLRTVWSVLFVLMLVYTGTLYPFRLAFLEFRMPDQPIKIRFWDAFEEVIDALFWIDLFLSFFLTYRDDEETEEIDHPIRIAGNYLKGTFWINLFACIPSSVAEGMCMAVIDLLNGANDEGASEHSASLQRGLRLTRLQRLSRLLRIVASTSRLLKVGSCSLRGLSCLGAAIHWKSRRLIVLLGSFFWITHIFACGWYVLAALHVDPYITWVERRGIMDAGPLEQWLTCVYFIITTFTTVGFGDMSAGTVGEMVFVSLTMLSGIVIESILMGEVINVVVSHSEERLSREKNKHLIEQLSKHAELPDELTCELVHWVTRSKHISRSPGDTSEVCKLLNSASFPQRLLKELPYALFHGKLSMNRFIVDAMMGRKCQPRFPILIASMGTKSFYECEEFVYHQHEHATSIYLVLEGVFAEMIVPGAALRSSTRGVNEEAKLELTTIILASCKKAVETTYSVASVKDLRPFQVFSFKNYFGDVEVQQLKPRLAAMLCVSPAGGSLLQINRSELTSLMEDYPECAAVWKATAQRRATRRVELISKRPAGARSAIDLAAIFIQRWFRTLWWRTDNDTSSSRWASSRRTSRTRGASDSPCSLMSRRASSAKSLRTAFSSSRSRSGSDSRRLDRMEASLSRIERILQTTFSEAWPEVSV